MGAVLPSSPTTIIYGGTNTGQGIQEAFRNGEIQKVIDVLDFSETVDVEIASSALGGATGSVTADYLVPGNSTAVILSVVVGGSAIPNAATVDVYANRYISGSLAAFISGITSTYTAPALPAVAYGVRADVTPTIRGALLYNSGAAAAIGIRATLNGLAAATGSQVRLVIRAAIFQGNPFNSQLQVN